MKFMQKIILERVSSIPPVLVVQSLCFAYILTQIVTYNQIVIHISIISGGTSTYAFIIEAEYFRKKTLNIDASSGVMMYGSLSLVAQMSINQRL